MEPQNTERSGEAETSVRVVSRNHVPQRSRLVGLAVTVEEVDRVLADVRHRCGIYLDIR